MGSVYGVEAFPLYWPEGWKRTALHSRSRGRYKKTFAAARDDLLRNLKLLSGASDFLISSNIPIRRDGLPLANMAEPDDTGVAVYWTETKWVDGKNKKIHRVIACDHWKTTRDNLRAIGVTIECMRTMNRAGATNIVEQAFTGFTALPANAAQRPWNVVLNLGSRATPAEIEIAYKKLALQRHPDRGGSHEAMTELNLAYAAALKART